jgi:hypothetical protein
MQLTEFALVDGPTTVLAQGCGTLEDHVHGLVLSTYILCCAASKSCCVPSDS